MNYELKKKLTKILIAIVSIFVLLFIILFIVQGCSNKKLSYEKLENKLVSASKKYLEEKELLPLNEAEIVSVYDSTLIENGYMKEYSEYTDDTTCTGYVLVQKNNEFYNYMPYLSCEEYETKTLKNEIISQIVTKEDGIYEMNNDYVYRGEYVNNYFEFAGRLWRIIKLTEDGYLKLVSIEEEEREVRWDDRYNIEVDRYYGINDFSKSRLKESLDEIYNDSEKFSNSSKKNIVCKDICVGKRDENDLSLTSNTECNEKYSCQYISLMDIKDSVNSSLDPNCNSLNNDSCGNYNYIENIFIRNWTTIRDSKSTYQVYYIAPTYFKLEEANEEESINLVIYINSNNRFEGDGTYESPYRIK